MLIVHYIPAAEIGSYGRTLPGKNAVAVAGWKPVFVPGWNVITNRSQVDNDVASGSATLRAGNGNSHFS